MTNNLLQACWDGDLARVRELLAQDPWGKVNQPTANTKTTPLFWAVQKDSRNSAEVTRLLLDAGADVNYVSDVDERGLTPLLATLNEDGCMDLAVVRLLVACGAAVNCHDKRNGYTPLHYACQRGERETAALLLDSGANLHAVTSFGYTALMCACNCSRADEALVAMLLERGAADAIDQVARMEPPEEEKRKGAETFNIRALHWACHPKNRVALANGIPDRSNIVRLLLRHGAQVQQPTDRGFTPLYLAVKYSAKTVKILLDHGADMDLKVTTRKDAEDLLSRAHALGTPETKALLRRYLAMRVRRCVLGPASEHSRRQRVRDLAPDIASFLV